MNNKRRELLKGAVGLLEKASGIVSMALDEEQDCLDNMPENLSDSERYQKMEATIDLLDDVVGQIDSAQENILEACG